MTKDEIIKVEFNVENGCVTKYMKIIDFDDRTKSYVLVYTMAPQSSSLSLTSTEEGEEVKKEHWVWKSRWVLAV